MSLLPPRGRLLAVDYGRKRIGLAICDADRRIASPLRSLPHPGAAGDAARRLVVAAREEGACGLVVGLPLNMDGSESDQTRAVRAFVELLEAESRLPVELVDERLTTYEAGVRMRALSRSGKRDKDRRNALAAQVILETYLGSLGSAGCKRGSDPE